ncbi:MAG: hypothetical protein IAE78_25925 [Myxococcus sp.]|nr:hypothetical protein [Myxococcus sp.]
MPKVTSRAPAQPPKPKVIDDIWSALENSGPVKPPPGGWKPARAGRAKYKSADQKAALQRCDDTVAALKKALAKKDLPAAFKGLKPKDVSVDTLGDFPYVTIKKNGRPMFDREVDLMGLRKLLPPELKRVPIGDTSPF